MRLFYMILALTGLFQACQYSNSNPITAHEQDGGDVNPIYHFTPPQNWMNDPNGMVYYAGEYHLFYQHYPDSNVWGPMHWGHAISEDLVHWEHLPVALYPDSLGFIFSGSAVIDYQNTTGFGTEDNPPMVAIYTYSNQKAEFEGSITFQNQALAYSLDSGRTWTKYQGNPVLNNPGIKDFRDPKVSWVEEFQKWIMILAVKDHVSIYSSDDLKTWEHESDFGQAIGAHGGVWECPDLFKLSDNNGNTHWVMLVSINPGGIQGGSGTQYFIGDFDGHTFTTAQKKTKWIDYGADNYAGVTWSNIPDNDEYKLFIGWMSNWAYANKIVHVGRKNMMTVPRVIRLLETETDKVLTMEPYGALENIKFDTQTITGMKIDDLSPAFNLEIAFKEPIEPFQMVLTTENRDSLLLNVSADQITLDRNAFGDVTLSPIFKNKHTAAVSNLENLSIWVDRSSIEVFVNGGMVNITDIFFTQSPMNQMELIGISGESNDIKYSRIKLKSAEI